MMKSKVGGMKKTNHEVEEINNSRALSCGVKI